MKTRSFLLALTSVLLAGPALAQQTPQGLVKAYDTLADVILSMHALEADFVRAVLEGHRHAASALFEQGDYSGASAQMALFASEGDNAVGGVRKRLLQGGHHHHHADASKEGAYEPGYVIVTRDAKQKILNASMKLARAKTDAERKQAWQDFDGIAGGLMKSP
ncbi:MAG TPA: hypothetical protein VIY27_05240 [Myxococcota bacterium]